MSVPNASPFPEFSGQRSPPPLRSLFLPRSRLLDLLDKATRYRLTLILAPAGYGKTSLLVHWLSTHALPVAWYPLSTEDAYLVNFVVNLASSLTSLFPDRATLIGKALRSGDVSPEKALNMLLSHLARRYQYAVLVLDDVQQVESAIEVMDAVNRLIREAGPRLHIVLSTRHRLPLPALARLQAAGQVAEITVNDLAFTPEEVYHLLVDVFDLEVSPRAALALHHRTEGWPIALHLAARLVREHGLHAAENLWQHVSGATRDLYDYLLHLVLRRQPPYLVEFLYRTSILDLLDPDLCRFLTGREDAYGILRHLERTGLFTFSQAEDPPRFRYHALFREFLRVRLREQVGQAGVRDLHRRAASLLLERGEEGRALTHLLAAGDFETALTLFQSLYRAFISQGHISLVEEWVGCFPRAWQEDRAELLLARAQLALVQTRLDDAVRLYEQASAKVNEAGDREMRFHLYRDLALLRRRQGRFDEAAHMESRALEFAATVEDEAQCMAAIAYCYVQAEGPSPQVFRMLEDVRRTIATESDPRVRGRVLAYQGRLYGMLGEFFLALEAWHEALAIAERLGHRYTQVGLLNNLAYYHLLLGDLEEAEDLSERSLAIEREFGIFEPYSMNIRAVVHAARGEWAAARAGHEFALREQQRLGDRREIPVTMNWLGLVARLEGRLEDALRWGLEGLARREELGEEYEIGLSLIDVGATYMARGEAAKAEEAWQRALDIFTRYQARYEQAQLHFYLAYLALTRRDEEALRQHLQQAMALARAYEHDQPPRCLYFFVQDKAWSAPLMAHALARGIVQECAECLLPRLGAEGLAALLPLLDAGSAQVRARAARLIASLRDTAALPALHAHRHDPDPEARAAIISALNALLALPPEPLRVQTLGRFRLWRGEQEITDWPRRSARDVFLLLLEHAPHPVSTEVLMDTLWPRVAPTKAAQRLRRAISDLRRVLEPELPSGLPSRYVMAREGTYRLHLPEGSRVDAVEFEDLVSEAKALAHQGRLEEVQNLLESALDLYQGPYLSEIPYAGWVMRRREGLQERFREALRLLAHVYLETHLPARAADVAHRAWDEDPCDEEAALLLMHALHALGRVPEALRVYEKTRQCLRQDLGVTPRRDLVAFYHHLRHQRKMEQ